MPPGGRYSGTRAEGAVRPCPPRRPGLQPGTTRSHPGPTRPRRCDRAGSREAERPAGNPDHPAVAGRAPAAARHPPCREAPGQEPQGDRGQGQCSAHASPAAALGRAGRSHRRAAERYLSGRAPLAAARNAELAAPATVQTRPSARPRRACARGVGAALPGPHGCGRGATAASHGPGRKYGGISPGPALSGTGEGLAQLNAAETVSQN